MQIKKYHITGFFFVLILGTLLHFTYAWSGGNIIVGIFSAVNESIWEHLKLIFWPALLFALYEYFAYGKEYPDFFAVKMTAILSALLFTVVFYYTYSGILGFNILLVDLLDFVLSDFLCFYVSYNLLNSSSRGSRADSIKGIAVLLLLSLCFILWTNNPPDLGIFWG